MTIFDFIRIDGSVNYRFPTSTSGIPSVANRNPQASQYETEVVSILILIQRRQTGRCLLDALRRHAASHNLTIVPATSQENAAAIPLSPQSSMVAGQPLMAGDLGRPITNAAGQPVLGTGGGSNVVVLFRPRVINPLRLRVIPPGQWADEVLLHELFHALRQMHGSQTNQLTRTPFGNEDELMAVLVTNIYASEGGALDLRFNHGAHGVFRGALAAVTAQERDAPSNPFSTAPLSEPTLGQRFAIQYRTWLEHFRLTEPELFQCLARVAAHFNPIREHLNNIRVRHQSQH